MLLNIRCTISFVPTLVFNNVAEFFACNSRWKLVCKFGKFSKSLNACLNNAPNTPIPDIRPCQKNKDDQRDDQQDYIELVNKLQRHTRCSPAYCLRVNRDGTQNCRFGYPKECEKTYIRDDGKGQPGHITTRNDPIVNPHNRLQLQ